MSVSIPRPPRETTHHARATWVSRQLARPLTEAEAALVGIVCDARRVNPWDLAWGSLAAPAPNEALVLSRGFSSTRDDALTRLVFAAHDAACRVVLVPHDSMWLLLRVSLRDRDSQAPTATCDSIEEAALRWRETHPKPIETTRCDSRVAFWNDPDEVIRCELRKGHSGRHIHEGRNSEWVDAANTDTDPGVGMASPMDAPAAR